MVEAGNHQHALLAEDAGLGAVGQDDTPALQSGAYAVAVNHRRLPGEGGQRAAVLVLTRGGAQFQ